ncbi:hypothetical protein AGMMS50230_22510 [Spirochaetia bacterium]|nr:hypothetical protein AGMMS50230_22510 [Spirochaetia bacterium]
MKKKVQFLTGAVFTAMLFVAVLSCGGGAGAGWTPEYAIGDTGPGGGKIFYVSPATFGPGNAWHYLEAAPVDMVGADPSITTFKWVFDTVPEFSTSVALGSGYTNTQTILNADPGAPAALACKNYTSPAPYSKNDWFFPSKDELNLLYLQKDVIGGLMGDHSSSSQSNKNSMWYQTFPSGFQGDTLKAVACHVRPIRAF